MTLSSAPSGNSENQEAHELSTEAQNRVNTVANAAIAVLDENLDAQQAVRGLFEKMVAGNLRDPDSIGKIQDGLYEARDARLAQADPTERLAILKGFSVFMATFTENIALMNRDIDLSNQANALKSGSDTKIAQVQRTYADILANNHPTQTA